MQKEMTQLKVSLTDAGLVCLEQDQYPDEPLLIQIHPDQVDLVCQWMQEAKSSLKG